MTVREVLRRLADEGWARTSQKGSHRQFEHPTKPGKVTHDKVKRREISCVQARIIKMNEPEAYAFNAARVRLTSELSLSPEPRRLNTLAARNRPRQAEET